MGLYDSPSSFESNLTLQTQNSFRDASFSSYLNKSEENMIRTLTNQALNIPKDRRYPLRKESEEIGVFGAEKYFKGEIEDTDNNNNRKFLDSTNSGSKMDQEQEISEESDHGLSAMQRSDQINMHPTSVRSSISCNSRSGLLPKQSSKKSEKGSKTRVFLAKFGCNCIDKKSTQINEKKFIQAKDISNKKTDPLSCKLVEKNTRNDCFSFPVLNSIDHNSSSSSNSKSENLAGKIEGDNNGGRLSLGRKLSLLNDWDVEVPTEDEMYMPASGMYNHDVDSDSSSDLFEIESFSTNGNSFLPHRASDCYAPSEVSIQWSVVTASAADFSVASDYEEVRTGIGGWRNSSRKSQVMDHKEEQKKRPGILSGCTDYKAVRVAGDEGKVNGGGQRGRRRSADCMAVGSMFRGVNTKTRFDPIRGNYGSDVCPIS